MNGEVLVLSPRCLTSLRRWPSWLVQRDVGVLNCPSVAWLVVASCFVSVFRIMVVCEDSCESHRDSRNGTGCRFCRYLSVILNENCRFKIGQKELRLDR